MKVKLLLMLLSVSFVQVQKAAEEVKEEHQVALEDMQLRETRWSKFNFPVLELLSRIIVNIRESSQWVSLPIDQNGANESRDSQLDTLYIDQSSRTGVSIQVFKDLHGRETDRFDLIQNPWKGTRFITSRCFPRNSEGLLIMTDKDVGLVGLSSKFRNKRLISHLELSKDRRLLPTNAKHDVWWNQETEYLSIGGREVAIDPPSSPVVKENRRSRAFWRKVSIGCAALGGLAAFSVFATTRNSKPSSDLALLYMISAGR